MGTITPNSDGTVDIVDSSGRHRRLKGETRLRPPYAVYEVVQDLARRLRRSYAFGPGVAGAEARRGLADELALLAEKAREAEKAMRDFPSAPDWTPYG